MRNKKRIRIKDKAKGKRDKAKGKRDKAKKISKKMEEGTKVNVSLLPRPTGVGEGPGVRAINVGANPRVCPNYVY